MGEGGGYDAPIDVAEEDVLGRRAFAREIAHVATTAPGEWSLRIAVYGDWGSGKTSVLRLVDRLVRSEGNFAAWFNPWGFASAEEMIRGLADAALDQLKQDGIDVPGAARRAAKGITKVAKTTAGAVVEIAQKIGILKKPLEIGTSVGRFASPWLNKWLGDRSGEFRAIEQALPPGVRLVVIIDDVDRADPKILPALLFALHEALSVGKLSYVLALDPAVVGRALREYHSGFGEGTEFLEKIIQFPRWLPEPAPDQLLALALSDVRRFAEFVPEQAVRDEFACLPKNPRALRTLIRNLWSLREEVARHDADELDWNLLLILSAIRSHSHHLLKSMLDDEALLDSFAASAFGRDKTDDVEKLEARVHELVTKHEPVRPESAQAAILSLRGRSWKWGASRIRYHAFLSERPHAVTWREFRTMLGCLAQPVSLKEVEQWIAAHAEMRRTPRENVVADLVDAAARFHYQSMDHAADSSLAAVLEEKLAGAEKSVELLRTLLFGSEERPVNQREFTAVLHTFRYWANFSKGPAHRKLRAKERKLLEDIAAASNADPAEMLDVLEPWDRRSERSEDKAELTDSVLAIAQARLAQDLVGEFKRPSGISGVMQASSVARRFTLFSVEPMWTPSRVQELGALLSSPSEAKTDNCRCFLSVLFDERRHGRLWLDSGEISKLLEVPGLLVALWQGVAALPVNNRFLAETKKLREHIEKRLGALADPPWWARVEAELSEDSSASASNDPAKPLEGVDGPP